MTETVSVVIPALNEGKNIKSCLIKLLNQYEKPLEIIVVDNGSVDNTNITVQNLKKKFKGSGIELRIFYYPFGNQLNARAFGIKKSRGTIIGSLDAEANPNNKWVKKIKEYFKDPKIVGIGGKSSFRNKGIVLNFFYGISYYLRFVINTYCLGGGNSAFRKSTFIYVGGYNGLEKLREEKKIKYVKDDFYLSKKLGEDGKLKFSPDLKVSLLYRIRNKNDKKYKYKYSIKEVLTRVFLEIYYDYQINKYFKDKKKE